MGKQKRRTRRSFSEEFKAETVKLVRGSDTSIGAIARELDLTETALRAWVRQAEIDAGRGRAGALTTDERPVYRPGGDPLRILRVVRAADRGAHPGQPATPLPCVDISA